MKASCPRCGRTTAIDQEVGDFPTRCTNCGALLRRVTNAEIPDVNDPVPQTRRIQQGALAGLLISQTPEPAMSSTSQSNPAILRPESRAEIARAAARQNALRKAQLRASMQSYSALNWAGLILIGLLMFGAMLLKANSLLSNPTPARADTLRVSGN